MKEIFEMAAIVVAFALSAALVAFCILSAALLAVKLFGV